jgi:hypothetical protein
MAIVYIHRKLDNNEIFYVGISKNKRRAFETYAKSGTRRNVVWKRITEKHGVKVEISHENICWEEACSIEKYLIEFWRGQGLFLANLTDGGEGLNGYKCTEEQRIKRISHLNTPEFREKQRQSMSRPDVLKKQSEIQKKVYSNPELREKQRNIQKIVQNTPEAIENNRKRAIKQFSDPNQKKRISNTLKEYFMNPENKKRLNKETFKYSLDGVLLNKYESTNLAAEKNNVSVSGIIKAIKFSKKYNGYIWKRS